MSQSDRAAGRVRDLRSNVLDRLRGHGPLTSRLEQLDSVDDGADVIVPAPYLEMQHRDGDATPPDAAIAVSVVTGSSTRENRQERRNMTVQTDLQLRVGVLKGEGLVWHDELADEISAVLTSHAPGWTALGETGGTPDPLPDDERNRYRTAQRFDVEYWG